MKNIISLNSIFFDNIQSFHSNLLCQNIHVSQLFNKFICRYLLFNKLIISCSPNSKIIATHQVYEIDKENKSFKTQGINNKDEDGNIIHDATPVQYASLIGKPVLCIKYLGYINRLITTPPGMYIIIMFTIFIILIYHIIEKNWEVN